MSAGRAWPTTPGTRVPLSQDRSATELAPKPDEQGLERQGRAEIELLERTPGLADDLAGPLGPCEPLGRAVLGQHGEPVRVDNRALCADRDHDEIPVPGGELLQRRQQLVPLGPARR